MRSNDLKRAIKYLQNVSDDIKDEIEKQIEPAKKQTKQIVKQNLTKGHGVDKGIYKEHIVINNLSKGQGDIHFQVGANEGHHRLTHLIENGHRVVAHGRDTGKRTRPMVHIAPGQEYIDRQAIILCKKGIKEAFERNL